MSEPVAIIGVGARFPGAPDSLAFRRLIREAAVHVQPVPAERWDNESVAVLQGAIDDAAALLRQADAAVDAALASQ